MTKVAVHLNHAALTLRVDKMVEGELGIKVAKQVAEIPLVLGRNEVDADVWKAWHDQNKEGPLVKGGIISVEKQETSDGAS